MAEIGEVLAGVEIEPIPDGCVVVDAVFLVQVMDAEGNRTWFKRATEGIDHFSLVGALTVMLDRVMAEVEAGWIPDGEES